MSLAQYGMRGLQVAQSSALKAAFREGAVFARQAAKAGATAANLVGGVNKVTNYYKKRKATAAPRVSSSGGGNGAAGYAGRFSSKKRGGKRPIRRRKRVTRKRRVRSYGENHFAQYGAISTKEVSGTLTDGDCVYIGHSSLVPDECLRTVVYAIVRKLYKEAIGYEADNMHSVIPYRTVAGAQLGNGHSILIKYASNLALNTKASNEFTISDPAASITSVGNQIFDRFKDQSTGSDIAKNERLLWIAVVDATTGHTRAHLDLTVMRVNIFSKSELKIQNVTIPSAEATSEDDVNNVPLVGRSYHINQWCPKTSDDDNNYLDIGVQNTGMITWRANQSSGVQYDTWKEPPPSKAFVNCTASALQRLEPGTIKSHMSMTRKSMKLEDFLLAIAYNASNASNKNTRIGTHDMFALERLIGMAGALPIKIVYECNFFTGASVTSRRAAAIMQKIAFATQNSTP